MHRATLESRLRRGSVLCGLVTALSAAATPAPAGEVELALQAGKALPFYEQSFNLDTRAVPGDLPIETTGPFSLDLSGGLTLSGAVTWRFSEPVGLEARVDSAAVELEVLGGQVRSNLADLLPGLPSIPLSGDLSGEANIDRLTPYSLNLQLGVGDQVRFVVSGGLSYVSATTLAATVRVRLGLEAIGLPIALPDLSVSAAATLDGGFGGNLGASLRVALAPQVSLVVEGRAFGFPTREVHWGTGSEASALEEALASALDPIAFQYGFFQGTAGLVLVF